MSAESATLSAEARKAARAALEATMRAAILATPGVAGFQSAGWRGLLGLRSPLKIRENRDGTVRVHTRLRLAADHSATEVAKNVRAALWNTRYSMERADVVFTRIG